MQRILALGLSVVLLLTGCASYTPSSMPVPKAGGMPVERTEGDVAVGADPYVEEDRQKVVFDGALTDEGVLPVLVHVRNEGRRRLLVRPSTMTLTFRDGSQVSPVGATAVAAKIESSAGVIGWTIAFGLIGFLAASSAEDKARAARLADYRSKELQDVTLAKVEATHGFVYFIPPPGTPSFTEAVLTVKLVDAEDFTGIVVRLPLMERAGGQGKPWGGEAPASSEALKGGTSPAAVTAPAGAGMGSFPPPSLPPHVAELIGTWRGTALPRFFQTTATPSEPVTLRLSGDQGQLRWDLTRVQQAGSGFGDRRAFYAGEVRASGAVEVTGSDLTLSGRYDNGPLRGTPITYRLSRSANVLSGTGMGADNLMYVLSVTRDAK